MLDVPVCLSSPALQADFCPGRLTWMVGLNRFLYLWDSSWVGPMGGICKIYKEWKSESVAWIFPLLHTQRSS